MASYWPHHLPPESALDASTGQGPGLMWNYLLPLVPNCLVLSL